MNTHEDKLTVGVPQGIELGYLHQIGRFIASMGGMMKASINPKIPARGSWVRSPPLGSIYMF